jgi:hypothetical protein
MTGACLRLAFFGVGYISLEGRTQYIYEVNELITLAMIRVAAAEWLGVHHTTVFRAIRSGKVFKGKYLLTHSQNPS